MSCIKESRLTHNRQIKIRVTTAEYEALHKLCIEADVTKASLLRRALRDGLGLPIKGGLKEADGRSPSRSTLRKDS